MQTFLVFYASPLTVATTLIVLFMWAGRKPQSSEDT